MSCFRFSKLSVTKAVTLCSGLSKPSAVTQLPGVVEERKSLVEPRAPLIVSVTVQAEKLRETSEARLAHCRRHRATLIVSSLWWGCVVGLCTSLVILQQSASLDGLIEIGSGKVRARHPTKNRLDSVINLFLGGREIVWRWGQTPIRVQPDAEFGVGVTELVSRDRTITYGPLLRATRSVFSQLICPPFS